MKYEVIMVARKFSTSLGHCSRVAVTACKKQLPARLTTMIARGHILPLIWRYAKVNMHSFADFNCYENCKILEVFFDSI